MTPHGKRSKGKLIYFHPDQPGDAIFLDLWEASKDGRGPQEVFRDLLRKGLRAAYEAGEIPPELIRRTRLHKFFQGLPVQGPIIQALPSPVGYVLMPVVDQTDDARPQIDHDEERDDRPVVRPRRPQPQEAPPPEVAEPEEPPAEPGSPASILTMMGRGARKPQQKGA